MIIDVTVNTETKNIIVSTEDTICCTVWYNVEFDSMNIQEIIQDVEEEILKNT